MKSFAAIARLLITLLVLLAATSDASLITQSGARHRALPAAAGGWADVFVAAGAVGPELATDSRVVGVDGTTIDDFLPAISAGNGCTLTFEASGAYDGESSVLLVPPDTLVGANADYCSILTNADVDNAGAKDVQQINLRFVAVLGPRYIDLAPASKWLSFHVSTAPGAASTNRAAAFESYVPEAYAAGRIWAVTADETQSYHEPEIVDCYHPDCGTAEQKGFIVRSTADHSGTPAVGGPNEPIYFELELDVSQLRGNANGRNKLYVKTRDGLIDKYIDIPLNWEGTWSFTWDAIVNMEGLGWFFNTAGTTHVDNWIRYSHIALSANRAVDDPIGPPPGFLTNFFLPLLILGRKTRRKRIGWRKRLVLAASLLALSFAALADVTNLGTPTSEQGESTTAATPHTVASGSDVVSYIAVYANSGTAISSMETFGGVAPTLVGTFSDLHLYRAVNPTAGATTAQANLAAAVIWSIHVITLQGVDTTDPDDATVSNTNDQLLDLSATVTSAAGELVIALGLMINDNIDVFDGATLSTEEEAISTAFRSAALVYEAGAASVTLGVSSTASFGDNAIIATAVNAAAGGGNTGIILKRRAH